MPERRRRRLVDSFQYKVAVRLAVYWAVYQLTLWNFLFCWRLLEEGQGNLFQQYGEFSREFAPMLICFLILVPAFAWDAVKFYHRIAGPILRIRSAARDIADGRAVRYVRLREDDELTGLQDDFNDMLSTLARSGAVTVIGQSQDLDTAETGAERAVDSPDSNTGDVSHVAS